MALSKPCCLSKTDDGAGIPVTSIPEAVTQRPTTLTSSEHEEELIRIRADMVCAGCRCGWLCCDCVSGCLSCKQRRRFCYCRWRPAAVAGVLIRIPCLVCLDFLGSCTCRLFFRCKWCTVSLNKCKRGGCITLLPSRRTTEAAPYVDIFNSEDKSDDEDERFLMGGFGYDDDGTDKRSFASDVSDCDSSSFSWDSQSNPSVAMSTWSVGANNGSCCDGSGGGDDRYNSNSTLNSVSSGGSYSSIGGKSDF